jgi:hypothetical protein
MMARDKTAAARTIKSIQRWGLFMEISQSDDWAHMVMNAFYNLFFTFHFLVSTME